MIEYTIVKDDAGHRYVIPFSLVEDWYTFVEMVEMDIWEGDVPEYAQRIDGGRVVFSNWRLT